MSAKVTPWAAAFSRSMSRRICAAGGRPSTTTFCRTGERPAAARSWSLAAMSAS
jgi:hypothetical protein